MNDVEGLGVPNSESSLVSVLTSAALQNWCLARSRLLPQKFSLTSAVHLRGKNGALIAIMKKCVHRSCWPSRVLSAYYPRVVSLNIS